MRSLRYTESLPSAPDGRYVILLFDARFKKKEHAVETVIPMLGTDGVWRVSGYDVR